MTRRILLRLFLSAPLSLATLVYLPILTRTLGKAQYGEWGLAMSVVTGVSAVATMGLAVVIPAFTPRTGNKARSRSGFGAACCSPW